MVRYGTVGLLFGVVCLVVPGGAQEAPEFDVAVRNVAIVPCHTDGVWFDRVVLIRNGRIARIAGSEATAWRARQIVDGTGKFLVPGLSDMHVHLPTQDLDRYFRLNLSAGVLYVRSMRGRLEHIGLRDSLEAGSALARHLFLSAPPILAKNSYADVDSLVGEWKRMGFDQVKILTATAAQLHEFGMACKRYGIPLGGHQVRELRETLEAGYTSVEHLGRYPIALEQGALKEAVETAVASGLYHCPTVDWYNLDRLQKEELRARAGMEFVRAEELEQWDAEYDRMLAELEALTPEEQARRRRSNEEEVERKLVVLRSLHDHGARILVSPDATRPYAVPGHSMLEEMRHYRRAGIGNMDILRYATIMAARFRGDYDDTGSIEEGKRADMVLLASNPLEDIDAVGMVEGIFLGGAWHSRSQLIDAPTE